MTTMNIPARVPRENQEQERVREAAFNAYMLYLAEGLNEDDGIITYLPEGWSAKVVHPAYGTAHVRVEHRDGRAFTIGSVYHTADPTSRIAITGNWPRDAKGDYYLPYGVTPPEITVKAGRPAHGVAQDIMRRFIDAYDALYVRIKADNDSRDAYNAKQRNTFERMVALTQNGRPVPTHLSETAELSFQLSKNGEYHRFSVHGDKVNLSLTGLRYEEADAIVELLKQGR